MEQPNKKSTLDMWNHWKSMTPKTKISAKNYVEYLSSIGMNSWEKLQCLLGALNVSDAFSWEEFDLAREKSADLLMSDYGELQTPEEYATVTLNVLLNALDRSR